MQGLFNLMVDPYYRISDIFFVITSRLNRTS